MDGKCVCGLRFVVELCFLSTHTLVTFFPSPGAPGDSKRLPVS